MAVVEKSVLIEHSAAQMFELIDRVEEYPQFLPWCSGMEVFVRSDTRTSARLDINYHGFRAHFATTNAKVYPRSMDISLDDGPFKHMDGGWRFTPLGETACKVEFRLHYEFSSKLLEKALGLVFHHIVDTLVDSFVKRAAQLHG